MAILASRFPNKVITISKSRYVLIQIPNTSELAQLAVSFISLFDNIIYYVYHKKELVLIQRPI